MIERESMKGEFEFGCFKQVVFFNFDHFERVASLFDRIA